MTASSQNYCDHTSTAVNASFSNTKDEAYKMPNYFSEMVRELMLSQDVLCIAGYWNFSRVTPKPKLTTKTRDKSQEI
eukprot:2511758-Amphidinium_carterae.1